MGKTKQDIQIWHEKLTQAGVDNTLIENTRDINFELQEKILSIETTAEVENMQQLYRYYAAAHFHDDEPAS